MKTTLPALGILLVLCINLHSQKLDWVNQLNSTGTSFGYAIAIDDSGNVYSTGFFQGTADFDPGPGTHNITASGQQAYVWKQDSSGTMVWAKTFNTNKGRAIAVDQAGSVYIAGDFHGTPDMDPGPGTFNLSAVGLGSDLFFLKLDAGGNFQWATSISGAWSEECTAIAADSLGNLYITGHFADTATFSTGSSQTILTSPGVANAFIAKIDSSGHFEWARQFGGGSSSLGKGIDIAKDGNFYAGGYFKDSVNFIPSLGVSPLTAAGSYDAYLCKMTPAGNLIWQKSFGGNGKEELEALCVSDSGYIYTTGGFEGTTDMAAGPAVLNLTAAGILDVFVTKMDTAGNTIWARNMGGPSAGSKAYAISTDAFDNVYTTGLYNGGPIDTDPSPASNILNFAGFGDIFISKLSASGRFDWAAGLGNSHLDIGFGIATDDVGNCYSTGHFSGSVDFDPDTSSYNLTSVSLWDSYVVKYSPCLINTQQSITACDSFNVPGTNLSFTQSGNYTHYISTPGSCDSLVHYSFNIPTPDSTFLSPTTCDSFTSPSGTQTWFSSGLYTDTLSTQNGCDSIMWVNLTVADTSTGHLNDTACGSYLSAGGKIWTSSGTYFDTIQRPGCDSIVQLNLVMDSVDVLVNNNSPHLTAAANADSYQWIYCDSVALVGDTSRSFMASANGKYAVVVSQYGCTDTSECVTVSNIDLKENPYFRNLSAYPSPTPGPLHLDMGATYRQIRLLLYDLQGRLIDSKSYDQGRYLDFDIKGTDGVYLLKVESENRSTYLKVVKSGN